ncbi:DNA recombination protein RmuC [Gardnerella sp. DNF00354]|uniref:DNA recombination protein RmuC n=1 Tax=Gardnerella sp. DNF00354 TaxID=2749046 RepID=UPI003BAE2D9C
MFDNIVMLVLMVVAIVITAIVVLAIVKRNSGMQGVNGVSQREFSELRSQYEQARAQAQENGNQAIRYRTQAEQLAERLKFVESELLKAQQAEQLRVNREEQLRAEREERERLNREKTLKEQGKVLEALAPVKDNLEALKNKVSQIEEGRKQEMGVLSTQLKGLSEQQTRLDRETSSLSAALRNNKVRGAWGEAQLKNIVESAGLLEHVDFDTQVVVTGVNSEQQRPDMVVHLPGGKTIPVDAKVPYADYQRACEIPDNASDEELARRSELLKAHAKALREHVRVLGAKAYWQAFETAPDFVVAFIPNEALLQAALEADPTLMDDAFAQKVALTSPVTLWAVLKSVAYAWQQQSLTDDAKELFDLSRELYDRFAVLGENASKLGVSLARTVAAYNKFASSLESRVLVTARKLQKLDQSKVIASIDLIDSDKADVKELSAPEVSVEDR